MALTTMIQVIAYYSSSSALFFLFVSKISCGSRNRAQSISSLSAVLGIVVPTTASSYYILLVYLVFCIISYERTDDIKDG